MAKDLTKGRIMPMLIRFTIPLILGNIFQLTYNAVDSIVVGRFVGKEALAAVGICNPVTTLIILFLKLSSVSNQVFYNLPVHKRLSSEKVNL